jgi:xanthine/uracil/vitamin C permease (AzgA family)
MAVKPLLRRLQNLDSISESMIIMILNIVNLFDGLGRLMICTHDLIVLTKIKEMTRYCELFRLRWQNALDNHFYCSNGVSVPTEDG